MAGPTSFRGSSTRSRVSEITPSAEELAESGVGVPGDEDITTEVPDDLPQSLVELTDEVVADAETPAAKAAAIQDFLRDGDYKYSVEPLPGMGYEALENFLLGTSWATASSSPRRWP